MKQLSRKTRWMVMLVGVLVLSFSMTGVANAARKATKDKKAKYVFFFIGDGMGAVQIHAAEAYLGALMYGDDNQDGSDKIVKMNFSKFPVKGMATTYADNKFITDSAAAGTALACGEKTSVGVIGKGPGGHGTFKSIAELARDHGMKVGIVSSVSIDHATPASFYAHQRNRGMMYEIAEDLLKSEFDYFGGGGLKEPYPKKRKDSDKSIYERAEAIGYKMPKTRDELNSCKPGDKVFAVNHALDGSKALYYDLDRPGDHISLAEFTEAGIRLLDNPNGFFMMVEGGKIDWACHANDAMSSIKDVISLDRAIKEAVKFYKKHPKETLIVVTADHETGGIALGYAGRGYESDFAQLYGQTMSYDHFNNNYFKEYKKNRKWESDDDNMDDKLKELVAKAFGLEFDRLSGFEKQQLERAFDRSMRGRSHKAEKNEDSLLYGGYEAFTVTCTHMVGHRAGIGWATYAHTGVPVPLSAIGAGAKTLDGFYDNTDIPKRMAKAMGLELEN